MTKRDLVKWLEGERTEALKVAMKRKNEMIEEAAEHEYNTVKLYDFINLLECKFEQLCEIFDTFYAVCEKHEGVIASKFHWKLSYSEYKHYIEDRAALEETVKDMIRLNTDYYNNAKRHAIAYHNCVEKTYDDVIQTVKNLPTAKDGLEYLRKLGFDVSKILPVEPKKQLPATIRVNVDTKYLLLDRNKDES